MTYEDGASILMRFEGDKSTGAGCDLGDQPAAARQGTVCRLMRSGAI